MTRAVGGRTAYLAPVGYEQALQEELARAGIDVALRHDRLLVTDAPRVDVAWVANVWPDVVELAVSSIADTARQLRALQRGWAAYAPVHRGRARLVTERLPHVSARPLHLGEDAPSAPLGSWTFLTPGTVLASAASTSPFPNGETRLVEDHDGPPSRAYLKLWEAVVVHERRQVQPGERCIDLGASPGGWTWYLARRGASVLAVDRAPLAPMVAALPGVEWRRGDAFQLDPASVPPADWLVSDVIAYPERVLNLVQRWQASGRVRTIVATVKFQGPTDHAVVERFRALPGATVFHLHHNKHELTVTVPGRPAR